MSQTPCRMDFRGFTWDLLLPSNIDSEIQVGRDWEPVVTNYIEQHVGPGMNVVDVGANIGWFTLIMSRLVTETGQVYAFEPEPSFCSRLRNHVALNFSYKNISDNVYLDQVALSDVIESVWCVKNIGPHFSSASICQTKLKVEDSCFTPIRCVPLDVIWNPIRPLHFIKIDVDGYELKVLIGAAQTITKYRPRMVIEIANNENAAAIVALLQSWNYTMKAESSMQVFSSNQIYDQFRTGEGTINVIAEPR